MEKAHSEWRAIIVVFCMWFAALVGGALLALGLELSGSSLLDLWLGGAIASALGLSGGVVWIRCQELKHKRIITAILNALLVVQAVVAIAAVGFEIPSALRHKRYISRIRTLDASSIGSVVICTDNGAPREEARITDRDVLGQFTRACAAVEAWFPQHPTHTASWHVTVNGSQVMELELYLVEGHDEIVFGKFVTRRGNTTYYHGGFRCRELYPWLMRVLAGERTTLRSLAN